MAKMRFWKLALYPTNAFPGKPVPIEPGKMQVSTAIKVSTKPAKGSFSGIQYTKSGSPIVTVIDRSKYYHMAYSPSGSRPLLIYQFEDTTGDPFSLPQAVINDEKQSAKYLVGARLKPTMFGSSNVGVHLFEPSTDVHKTNPKLRSNFMGLVQEQYITKIGLTYMSADEFKDCDALVFMYAKDGTAEITIGEGRQSLKNIVKLDKDAPAEPGLLSHDN